jgi:dTDP-4-dehydrorhamnose reductase
MRALITGGGGQLASELAAQLEGRVVELSRAELDITDTGALARALKQAQPDVVFNCAAFHNVDACEREPEKAWAANVHAVAELAKRLPKLVHISTNYVFDGVQREPYAETDRTRPLQWYGLSKLAGEYAALAYSADSLIVRAAGLYGLQGSASKGGNFVQRMVTRAREHGELHMVADQTLQPTFTRDLAAALIEGVMNGAHGVVHVTADGACSWHEFTVAIMDIAGLDFPVHAVETTIPPGAPNRPLNAVLARPRADAQGVPRLRPWREQLEDYMERAGLAAARAPS